MSETATRDTGTGYGQKKPTHNARLTAVGPGTPMGEAMRRYWHPVASSAALKPDVPHRTRVLGEDLIVFRDKQGRAGIVFERCIHRGASLYYARIEEDGIRCCYHGWKFDVQGRCLEQPCEPANRRYSSPIRQPWYPVEERYGLVFVYMGPPERKPALPRYDAMENPEEGEYYHASWPLPGLEVTGLVNDFNWLQLYENSIDPAHVCWLHSQHSGFQFVGTGTAAGLPENYFDPDTVTERLKYEITQHGVAYEFSYRDPEQDGVGPQRIYRNEMLIPTVVARPKTVVVARPKSVGSKSDTRPEATIIWIVPSDDTHHRVFFSVLAKSTDEPNHLLSAIKQNGKNPWELTEQERQRFPADMEAQSSQGPITLHSFEHLVGSDRGVAMLRRLLEKMVADVEAGRDPIGATTDEAVRKVTPGIYTVHPGPHHEALLQPAP